MSAPSLATEWSLDTSFPGDNVRPAILNSTSPEKLAAWVITTSPAARWAIHFTSNLIKRIPPSESRIRNEGFIRLYKAIYAVNTTLTQIAQQNEIPLLPFPDPYLDYEQEASDINRDLLAAAVMPQVAPQMKELLGTMGDLMRTDGGYHWTSIAAFFGEAVGVYSSAANETKKSQPALMEHKAAPFAQGMSSDDMLEACKVIREELIRCRAEASQTGWRDDEARGLVQEFLEYLKGFPAIGL